MALTPRGTGGKRNLPAKAKNRKPGFFKRGKRTEKPKCVAGQSCGFTCISKKDDCTSKTSRKGKGLADGLLNVVQRAKAGLDGARKRQAAARQDAGRSRRSSLEPKTGSLADSLTDVRQRAKPKTPKSQQALKPKDSQQQISGPGEQKKLKPRGRRQKAPIADPRAGSTDPIITPVKDQNSLLDRLGNAFQKTGKVRPRRQKEQPKLDRGEGALVTPPPSDVKTAVAQQDEGKQGKKGKRNRFKVARDKKNIFEKANFEGNFNNIINKNKNKNQVLDDMNALIAGKRAQGLALPPGRERRQKVQPEIEARKKPLITPAGKDAGE